MCVLMCARESVRLFAVHSSGGGNAPLRLTGPPPSLFLSGFAGLSTFDGYEIVGLCRVRLRLLLPGS